MKTKTENKNLFNVMEKIVDQYVEHYKTDFEHDKKFLLDKDREMTEFIWLVRDSGTEILPLKAIMAKGSPANINLQYHLEQGRIIKAYHLKINKIGRKYAYGTIDEVKVLHELKNILRNVYENWQVKLKITYEYEKDNKIEIESKIDWFTRKQINHYEHIEGIENKKIVNIKSLDYIEHKVGD